MSTETWIETFKKETVDIAKMDVSALTYDESAGRMRRLLRTGEREQSGGERRVEWEGGRGWEERNRGKEGREVGREEVRRVNKAGTRMKRDQGRVEMVRVPKKRA
jgi:hypothetical protein